MRRRPRHTHAGRDHTLTIRYRRKTVTPTAICGGRRARRTTVSGRTPQPSASPPRVRIGLRPRRRADNGHARLMTEADEVMKCSQHQPAVSPSAARTSLRLRGAIGPTSGRRRIPVGDRIIVFVCHWITRSSDASDRVPTGEWAGQSPAVLSHLASPPRCSRSRGSQPQPAEDLPRVLWPPVLIFLEACQHDIV